MSGILRSGKFIRCFSNVVRTYLSNPRSTENNPVSNPGVRPVSTSLAQSWNKHNTQQQVDSLEPLLQRLDADVRKFGRLSRKDLDEMLEEVRQKHYVSSSQSLLIIRCCGDLVPEELPEVRTKLVKEIWNTLVERGVPMDISHYNALLRVYVENEHKFSPEEFLKEMEGKGISPNRVTYQRLMWRYCQQGDVEGASRILELMRSNELPLSSAILDALVLGHAKLGDVAGARAVVTAMASAGLEPGSRTYALLAGCSGRRGDTDELKNILKECADKDIYLSDKDLMYIIEDCAAGGHQENIEFLLGQMQHTAGYNTDAITLILRLITLGYERAALLVYRTLSKPANPVTDSNVNHYRGAFFIKQLVKANRPVEVITSLCQELQNDGSVPKAFIIATESALFHGNQELALNFFQILKDSGEPIRQHYFWPLFVALGKEKNHQGIFQLLKKMTTDLQIGVSMETLKDYVLPQLKKSDPNHVFDTLISSNVLTFLAGRAVVYSLLNDKKLHAAANFTKSYGINNSLSLCRPLLVNVALSKNDIEPFVTIIHSGVSLLRRGNQPSAKEEEVESEEGDERHQEYRATVGNIAYNVCKQSQLNRSEVLPALLESLYSLGIGISVSWAEKIQDHLGANMTNNISEILAKLTADDLEPKTFLTKRQPLKQTPGNLEKIIMNIESKGETASGLKKKLIDAYMAERQTEKLNTLLGSLSGDSFNFSPGLCCALQDYYCQENDIDKALMYHNKVLEIDPQFVIGDIKILRLVNLLIASNQDVKAMEILQSQPQTRDPQTGSFIYKSMSWRILNTLAEMGDGQKLHAFFNKLKEMKYIEPNNYLLGPLIKVHLVNDNIEGALKEFEKLCNEYKCTPLKNELTKKLISLEDASGLQKLTDLSTSIHGEVNSLYDLVFGFVECGRVRQARKILETPGLRTRNEKFNHACERYAQEGKTDYLEGLLEATKELSHIDRSEVFQQLLNTYIKEGNPDKAIGLWTLIQEESEIPTDKFLLNLGEFLKSKNIEVPFVLPKIFESDVKVKANPQGSTAVKPKVQSNILESLQQSRTEEVLQAWRQSPKTFTRNELSMLIEQLIQKSDFDSATDVAVTALKNNYLPYDRVVKFLLNMLAQGGHTEKIDEIGSHLPDPLKKLYSFDNRRANSIVSNGGYQKILDDLSNKVDKVADDEELRRTFPLGTFLGILMTYPDVYSKCAELVEKYSKKNIIGPANMLWTHHIINNDDEKALNVWNQHLSQSNSILFRKVLQEARSRNSTELVDKTLFYIKKTNISPTALGVVYSAKIDILVSNDKLQESEQVLQEALSNDCQLKDINRSSLIRLKKALESKGQQFNYQIERRH